MDLKRPDLLAHYKMIREPLLEGRVIPFLGAGVNLCGRPAGADWLHHFLPSGWELTRYLVENFGYPEDEPQDLLRVSQYVAVMTGGDELHRKLRRLLDREYPTTPVHTFLAGLPALMRIDGRAPSYPDSAYPLLITTNYDDVLERAFDAANEPYDVIFYHARGKENARFLHRPHGDEPRPIPRPKTYRIRVDGRDALLLERRAVILKIHGALDRKDSRRDSYVITEDDYIDYLSLPDITGQLPLPLPEWLRRSKFLFLGYSLADWNMRAFLHRVWKDEERNQISWAVEIKDSPINRKIWGDRKVDIITAKLEDYFADLADLLTPPTTAGSPTA